MPDEPTKILLGDTAISAGERGRGFRRRRKKMEGPPLTHCENCGTLLTGHYCANCGQPAIDYRRSFRHVITDILDSFLSWDSKILSTFWFLLTRPLMSRRKPISNERLERA